MEKILFNSSENVYTVSAVSVNGNVCTVTETTAIPTDIRTSGFVIVNENNGKVMADFGTYTTLYRQLDNGFQLSCDGSVYVEPQYDAKITVVWNDSNNADAIRPESVKITYGKSSATVDESTNWSCVFENVKKGLEVKASTAFGYDITVNGTSVTYSHASVVEAKQNKIAEITNACATAITSGVDFAGKHYSYTSEDQANILNLVTMSETGLDLPYHADGESCRLYSAQEILTIYVKGEVNITKNTTYQNQLKLYVKSCDTVEQINAVQYGVELTGEYLNTFNMMMSQAMLVMCAYLKIDEDTLKAMLEA